MRTKLLQIVEPFHQRWSKRDSFSGLHSDSQHPLRLCRGTSVKRDSSRSFTGFGNNRTFLNNGSLNDRQLVQHFGCGNVLGAKISELVLVTINMKELNMTSLTSLSDVVRNVARHAGNALIVSSCYTGRAVGKHGDSKRALLVAVEEVTINHDGLSARHDRDCHRVCFRFTRGSGNRIGNRIGNKGGEVDQSTLKETNMATS